MTTLSIDNITDIITKKLAGYRQVMSEEMKMPDIKGRHLFTARLRIILFLSTWLMFFVFFPAIWKVSPFVPLIFNIGFFITAVCYLYVIRYNTILLSVMVLEVFADIVSQTVIIYIVGLDGWAPFLIYGLYVTAAGILSGFHAAMIASTVALISYNILFILIYSGAVPAFNYPDAQVGFINLDHLRPYLNLVFLPIAFVVIVYSVRIANFFSKMKEHALERRNVQLSALNHIGSTIRRALHVQRVIDQVLKAVIQGLGFDVCILALVSAKEQKVRFYLPEGNYYTVRLEEILGVKYKDMFLPTNSKNNSAYTAILRNRILVRNNFTELTFGIQPEISLHNATRAQKVLGFKKFVITPLVAEQRVVGAIIGASKKAYVEDTVIDTLDNFANQAALAIESAQMIETLEHKNKELIQANKIKSEFLAIMSHELRTPLNAVIGYTEALLDKVLGDLNAEQSKSLSEVLRNGNNLLELINSILDLAKLEAGKMELNAEDFDLVELVKNMKASLMSLVEKKEQILTIHTQENIPFIKADAVKVRQILMNLVGNAIKFTNNNGEIDVFIEYHENIDELYRNDFSGEMIPAEISDGPAFMLRVRDTGIGIREEDVENIFALFQQADSSYTRKHEGTGLGLALTKQLVLLHSGYIVVESDYGKGTEFKILLPQLVARGS